MIDLKLSFEVSANGKDLHIADTTVWPSDGVDRNSVTLHLFALSTFGSIQTPHFPLINGTPENVSSWDILEAEDGSYKFIVVTAPVHDPLNAYPKNSLVSDQGILYRATKDLIAGTSITAANCWYAVGGVDDLLSLTSFPNSSYLIAYFLKDDKTRSCLGEKALAYAKKSCGCSDTCSQIEDYHWTKIYFESAHYSFGFGDYKEAGEFLGSAYARCGGAESSPCNCH